MKTVLAITESKKHVETILKLAGLKEGLSASPQEIKISQDVFFWYMAVTSKEASEKETYVTYTFRSLDPSHYSDNVPVIRKPSILIEVFSRKRNVDSLLESINDAFLSSSWTFELSSMGYDSSNLSFYHSFVVEALLSDE